VGLRECEEIITYAFFFVLTQYRRATDRRTDRRTDTLFSQRPAL